MTKAIIYKYTGMYNKDHCIFFCEDGHIYFESNGLYVDAKDALAELNKKAKLIKRMPGLVERKKMIENLLSMKYDEAAKYHLKYQKSKGREGKLFEGEFNDK
jgi:hypothetical protein